MTEKAKFNLLYTFIALTTLPFLLLVHRPEAWTIRTGSLFLSAFLGYAGISILLWMYILGTRSVAGLFFRNLPSTIKIHKKLGKYGVVFIFLHPLLVAYNYGENVINYTLIPNLSTSFEKHVSYGRVGFLILLIIWFTSAILRAKIAFRPWKYIHYLAYVVLPLSFLHVPRLGSSYPDKLIQFYWLTFIVIYLIITALRLRHIFGFSKYRYLVLENQRLNDKVYMIHLRGSKNLNIQPGQYVYLQTSLMREEHPFTVLDFDNSNNDIWITYKVFGKHTQKMSKIGVGSTVLIDGPYGIFTGDINDYPKRQCVFIAGGIGITPFIKHIKNDSNRHMLFYANYTSSTAVFKPWIRKKMGDRYIDILSRDSSNPGRGEARGRISSDIISKHVTSPELQNYYICGSKGFIETVKSSLKSLGVPIKQIQAEEFDF